LVVSSIVDSLAPTTTTRRTIDEDHDHDWLPAFVSFDEQLRYIHYHVEVPIDQSR
jgi:hypothetical protein